MKMLAQDISRYNFFKVFIDEIDDVQKIFLNIEIGECRLET